MKLLGAHMSIAGGVEKALVRGAEVGCAAIQIFTKNNNQWKASPLAASDISEFRKMQQETGIEHVMAHDSYLINLASPNPDLYDRSVAAFDEELDRCAALGIPYLIAHPGAHVGSGLEEGIERIASALNRLLPRRSKRKTSVLLETTAGQGSSIGHRFEHLRDIIDRLDAPDSVGVCVDTCHVFAAGYDLRKKKSYEAVWREFDTVVGLEKIRAFHLNDCKKDLGCRVDRHEHIGQGFLGEQAFGWLMNDRRFDGIPMVLETPKGKDHAEDRMNLAVLRGLMKRAR